VRQHGFIAEFHRGFISHVDGDWNCNLDAFDDFLTWRDVVANFFGSTPPIDIERRRAPLTRLLCERVRSSIRGTTKSSDLHGSGILRPSNPIGNFVLVRLLAISKNPLALGGGDESFHAIEQR